MFQQHHDQDREHHEFGRERRSSRRGKGIRLTKSVRWIDGSNIGLDVITRRILGDCQRSGRLYRLENLNNINGWANSEIVYIIKD
jgi:hypothetical protein